MTLPPLTRQGRANRLGFTMIEILTSVTLALMLMYAVARIFSRVGNTMNETTSVMQTASELRNARDRLRSDLQGLSLPIQPPQTSAKNRGYFCYVEGLGAPFDNPNLYNGSKIMPFSVSDIALDTERYLRDGVGETDDVDLPTFVDNTVGDLDDILSFTAKAPEEKPFRGRYVEPIYDENLNIIGGKQGVYESQYAEIIWFVRGTTLYRRVLPIIPDSLLQDSLKALDYEIRVNNGSNDSTLSGSSGISATFYAGLGFYRLYDASVHLNSYGRVVANTLGDLSNRKNRYFYWNSVVPRLDQAETVHIAPNGPNGQPATLPLSIHGQYGAWYWLRMPTLKESAAANFRAGAPFGSAASLAGSASTNYTLKYAGEDHAYYALNNWPGYDQDLTFVSDGSALLGNVSYLARQLPESNSNSYGVSNAKPFIDFWFNPNIWEEVDFETGNLNVSSTDLSPLDKEEQIFNQDVILTNVLSFNVRAWDPNVKAFVDLGHKLRDYANDDDITNSTDLGSGGYYATARYFSPIAPCVYDTWTEEYQRDFEEFCNVTGYPSNSSLTGADPNSTITAAQLADYPPPPYDVALKALQVELRVFDPRSRTVRSSTFTINLEDVGM
ncbi:MAG: hypothetical protein Q4G03_11660 [Planctomycetia bacterium]|nr:hypothetical protein [Planctomycetia bacterium]